MKYSILPAIIFLLTGLISPLSQASPLFYSGATTPLSSPYNILLAQGNQSLDDAVQSVKQESGGRILSAKTVTKDGKRVHKIKVLLPSGKVRVFIIDAE